MSPASRRLAAGIGAVAVIAALVVIKAGLLRGNSARTPERPAGGAGGPTSVRVVILQGERMSDRIATVGTILPNEEVDVRSEIAGRIETIAFDEGAHVTKGQLLVRVADAELRAQLARAEARLAIAQDEADRQRQYFEQSLSSKQVYDTAVNELSVAKADADLVRVQLAKTEIRAPFDGKVGLRFVSAGSYVSPAAQITTLQDDTPIKLDFSVPERYAGRLQPGDAVQFTVQGASRQFEASIYAIEPSIDPTTRTLRVRARTPNTDGALVPGAFADVEVVLDERQTLTVPAYAVIPELRGHRVFVYAGGKAESRVVEIGTRTEELVEVVRGLQPGDTLITSAILQLRPGAPVTVASLETVGNQP